MSSSNLSDVPSMTDGILNENLKIEVVQVMELERRLKSLVEKRDVAKAKADEVEKLRRKEMGDSMITTLLDLIESVKKVELEIDKTKESLERLHTDDPQQVAKDFNTKLDAIRRKLSSMRQEREAKEVIYKRLLIENTGSLTISKKENHNVQPEAIDEKQ